MFGQNMTGIQGVNFYTPTIFETIGFGGTKVVLLASGEFSSSLFIILGCEVMPDLDGAKVKGSDGR